MGLIIFIGATGFIALCIGIWACVQMRKDGKKDKINTSSL